MRRLLFLFIYLVTVVSATVQLGLDKGKTETVQAKMQIDAKKSGQNIGYAKYWVITSEIESCQDHVLHCKSITHLQELQIRTCNEFVWGFWT